MQNKVLAVLAFIVLLVEPIAVQSKPDSETNQLDFQKARRELDLLLKEDNSPVCMFDDQDSHKVTVQRGSKFETKNGEFLISQGSFLFRGNTAFVVKSSDASIEIPGHSIVLIVKTASNDERVYCLFSPEDILVKIDKSQTIKLHTRQALEMADHTYNHELNLLPRIGTRLFEKHPRENGKSATVAEFYVIRCIGLEPLLRSISLSKNPAKRELIQSLLKEYVEHSKQESIKGQYLQTEKPKP
ncbi:MAG: hypothetical protein K2X81_04145 [Candidatus Obscuribacterales bacterium]|nr:hypothetical protein [Candidatus Obscuribacterales bacterium]